MADAGRQQQAGGRLRHKRKVHEGRRQLCRVGEINQIAMQEHGGADPDSETRDRGNDRLLGARQRINEVMSLRRLALSRCDGGEVREVVAGGESVAFGAEQHHADARIPLGCVQRLGRGPVHGVRQRILLVRAGEDDVEHRAVPSNLQVICHVDLLRSLVSGHGHHR
jgi:hypothetical protein